MIISGAFLAEAAAVKDNKLQIWGGVMTNITVGPDRIARFAIVLLTQAESSASSSAGRHAIAGDTDRLVEIEVRSPHGDEALRVNLEVPEDLVESEVGCAFFPIEIQVPSDGRHVLVLDGCGAATALPLTVHS